MKNLKYNLDKELIAYASAFVSFVIPKLNNISEIVLFGSVARGESDKDSDVDLFFNLEIKEDEKKVERVIKEELKRFYKSKIAEIWFSKGIKNEISIKVGELNKWKLKRSVISDGICLYGRYKETPENMKDFVLFNIEPIKNITNRNKIIREIFGRKEKGYSKQGLLEKFNGKRLSASSFVILKENSNEVINFIGKHKINYQFFEFWTDNFNI